MKNIEIDLSAIQNENARENWGEFDENQCILCGKKVGANPRLVHYLTNGNITEAGEDDVKNSQGYFPVGSECIKKIDKAFKQLQK